MRVPATKAPDDATAFYRAHGYYCARGVLPGELLSSCQEVIEQWVEATAEGWERAGLLTGTLPNLDFRTRFNALWLAAGKPPYQRSPRKPLVELAPEKMFGILRHPALLDLAQTFIGTPELVSHGIWNSRPKTPDSKFTDTPWHQDAQYFRDQAHIHIMTIWFPLHEVDENSSCLAVSPDLHEGKLYENHNDQESGFVGIKREEANRLSTVPVRMNPGDALCFPQLTPHRAMPNRTDKMRWSMDFRFVATGEAMSPALDHGFIARSADASLETPYQEWLQKWQHGADY